MINDITINNTPIGSVKKNHRNGSAAPALLSSFGRFQMILKYRSPCSSGNRNPGSGQRIP